MLLIYFLIPFLFMTGVYPQSNTAPQQLIIFTQNEKDQFFTTEFLPKIENYCIDKGIQFIQREASLGLPAEITSTPAIIYQNAKGRSIYAARYAEFSSIPNFIRTSRAITSLSNDVICKDNVLRWQNGRTQVMATLKITSLKGNVKNINLKTFQTQAAAAIADGMTTFSKKEQTCLQKTDRQFYLDIHPYVNEQQVLFLSIELYSQFNCISPVFSKLTEPIKGKMTDYSELFERVGQIFEAEIFRQMMQSREGDAFSAVSEEVPIKNWNTLKLDLPKSEKTTETIVSPNGEMAKMWVYDGPIEEDFPIIQFNFQAPLDRYAGEVKQVNGNIQVDKNNYLKAGRFDVETQSLTMGIPEFDAKVLKKYIKAFRFPNASFEFEGLQPNQPLKFGQTTLLAIPGTFQLMRKKKQVTMQAQLTPLVDEQGARVLQVNASFSLNITDNFGIEGPDGPDPAKKTMNFQINFLMKPR